MAEALFYSNYSPVTRSHTIRTSSSTMTTKNMGRMIFAPSFSAREEPT